MNKTAVRVDTGHLADNIRTFSRLTKRPLIVAVKGNAYGHGIREVVPALSSLDCVEYLAVDNCDEAAVAAGRGKKVLTLGWGTEEEIREYLERGVEMVIPSPRYLEKVERIARETGKTAGVQIKVETGTSRLGMQPREALKCMEKSGKGTVRVTGVYSHFANIEDTLEHDYARKQLEVFRGFLKQVNPENMSVHFSCSAAALLFPETYFDLVRLGISAYGMWPSRETYISYRESGRPEISLKPVMTWTTRVAQVKDLERGQGVGYGVTYRTFASARMAVLPVGYADGYDRGLSNVANVLIRGVRAPLRGRVCMNMIIVDVTHIPGVKAGEEAVLLGRQGTEQITAEELAGLAGTINYEMVTRINPLIARRVVKGRC